jgi:Amt family ammonium transporter
MTGVFASKTISGVEGSIVTQAMGAGIVLIYSLLVTALLLWITLLIVGVRVDERAEIDGLDISQHRERLGS